ncbi:STAS domain-containing protein [Streptomyces sp. XM4193]|uniref:STAS domain-containing protein n=1 Tax=Streptomyces sp. XM4193 TaxID=2929782 RepID=UPI001FFB963F|nr:STAS domain-containing protein [Streptomyces sp. XM4193]MCK1796944.1 STAS domain-containing protein [Streptomyces sp. XM4193]
MDRGIPGSTSHRGRLTVDVHDHGASAVIAPRGELDHHTADLLRASLERCVEEGRKLLVVDCSGLDFCDSTGLNVLLGARLQAQAAGGSVALADMSPLVARLFEITGAGAVFSVFDAVDEALSAPEQPSGS